MKLVPFPNNFSAKPMKLWYPSYLAILDVRNTPTQGAGSSPAQRLMNLRKKTLLPRRDRLLQLQADNLADERTLAC